MGFEADIKPLTFFQDDYASRIGRAEKELDGTESEGLGQADEDEDEEGDDDDDKEEDEDEDEDMTDEDR